VLRPILQWAREQGIRISAYLDDLIIVAATKDQSERDTIRVQQKLEELGFLIKQSKSHTTPTQRLDHLGYPIDTQTMALEMTGSKIRDIRRLANKMAQKGTATVRQLSSFIGKTQAMLGAVFPARLQTRNLLQIKNEALAAGRQWSDMIPITIEATKDLLWWRTNLRSWNGHTWIPRNTDIDVYTDASDDGWGIVIGNQTWAGEWSSDQAGLHINHKELLTVMFAIHLPVCQGQMINIVCDNMTTLAYINHFGGTRSPALMQTATQLWRHCLKTDTRIRTTYIPSAFNPADAPS